MAIDTLEPDPPRMAPPAEEIYRPISSLAVISLIVSIVSLLAFASPYFLSLSGFAFLFAVMSLWRLSRMRAEYAGEMLAQIALLLALISGLGASTAFLTQRAIMSREAQGWGDAFVDRMLESRVKEAFVYLLPPANRPSEGETDDFIMRYSVNYRQFLDRPFLRALEGRGKEAQVTKYGAIGFSPEVEGTAEVVLLYDIELPERLAKLILILRGAVAPSGEWDGRQWYVHDAQVRFFERKDAEKKSEP